MALNPNLKSSQLSEINSQLLSVLLHQEELKRQCWLQGGRRQTALAITHAGFYPQEIELRSARVIL